MQALAGKMRGRIVPADDATGSGDGAARNSGGGGDDVLYATLPVPSGAAGQSCWTQIRLRTAAHYSLVEPEEADICLTRLRSSQCVPGSSGDSGRERSDNMSMSFIDAQPVISPLTPAE